MIRMRGISNARRRKFEAQGSSIPAWIAARTLSGELNNATDAVASVAIIQSVPTFCIQVPMLETISGVHGLRADG